MLRSPARCLNPRSDSPRRPGEYKQQDGDLGHVPEALRASPAVADTPSVRSPEKSVIREKVFRTSRCGGPQRTRRVGVVAASRQQPFALGFIIRFN
jgi:hypothetical protein